MKNIIFVVGFPRSGTTLLQTILMCDSSVYSCPETHVFDLASKPKGLLRFIPSLCRLSIFSFKWFLRNYNIVYIPMAFSKKNIINLIFRKLEDLLAKDDNNKLFFLEKTPDHLLHLDEIRKFYPHAKIVHIVRERKPVVESFVKASEYWTADSNTELVNRKWFQSISLSAYEVVVHGDVFVRYEDLVDNLESSVEMLNSSLGLNIEISLIESQLVDNAKSVVSKEESWKSNNLSAGVHKPNINYAADTFKEEYLSVIKKMGL